MKGIRIDVSLLRSTVEKVLENSLPDQDQMAVVFDRRALSFWLPQRYGIYESWFLTSLDLPDESEDDQIKIGLSAKQLLDMLPPSGSVALRTNRSFDNFAKLVVECGGYRAVLPCYCYPRLPIPGRQGCSARITETSAAAPVCWCLTAERGSRAAISVGDDRSLSINGKIASVTISPDHIEYDGLVGALDGSFFVPPTFCPIWSDLMISIHDGGYYRISTSYGTYFLQRERL